MHVNTFLERWKVGMEGGMAQATSCEMIPSLLQALHDSARARTHTSYIRSVRGEHPA